MPEFVLVIPADHLAKLGSFTGFTTDVPRYWPELLQPDQLSFRPRAEVEVDPTWLQIIPYVVFSCGDQVFHYRRGGRTSETRLRALRSIGVGGHINPIDQQHNDVYRAGLERELQEEVAIGSPFEEQVIGLIHDPSTPVGQVHLGVVHRFELKEPKVEAKEEGLTEFRFSSVSDLFADRNSFETWSQFVLDHLSGR